MSGQRSGKKEWGEGGVQVKGAGEKKGEGGSKERKLQEKKSRGGRPCRFNISYLLVLFYRSRGSRENPLWVFRGEGFV